MRVTNVDSLSAYFDRLISEKIKWYFFNKDGKTDEALHQEAVIKEIRIKLVELFEEAFENHGDGDFEVHHAVGHPARW